jgi:hypothetical protein
MGTALVILLGFVFISIIFLSLLGWFGEKYRKTEEIPAVSVGRYIAGLSEYTSPTENVICVIDEQSFVFRRSLIRMELGRIPRDLINQIIVENRSQIIQRLTVPRMFSLGMFSPATPEIKRHEECYLVIDWDDNIGVRQYAVFEFLDNASANLAVTALNKYTSSKKMKS